MKIKKIVLSMLIVMLLYCNTYFVKAWGVAQPNSDTTWISNTKTQYINNGYKFLVNYTIKKGDEKIKRLFNEKYWAKISDIATTDSNVAGATDKYESIFKKNPKISIKGFNVGRAVITFEVEGTKYFILVIVEEPNTDQDGTDYSTVDVIDNTDYYKPGDIDRASAGKIESKTSKILTVISNIGIAVSVIILAILGVKYMIGSVEEKAEYKQDMIPYMIGALLLFGVTGFLKILIAIGEKINS